MATGRPNNGYVTPLGSSVAPTNQNLGSRLNNVEGIVQAVLWVGIISLVAVVLSLVVFLVQSINSDVQARNELNRSVQALNAKLDAQGKNNAN